jgi:hypothetical protein
VQAISITKAWMTVGMVPFLLTGGCVTKPPQQPNDTDLKAAYCVQGLTDTVRDMEALQGSDPKDSSDPLRTTVSSPNEPESLRQAKAKWEASWQKNQVLLEATRASVDRLNLYLKPRTSALNPRGLLAARQAAKEDSARLAAAISKCSNECFKTAPDNPLPCLDHNEECAAQAMPDLPSIEKRMRACNNPADWLPF